MIIELFHIFKTRLPQEFWQILDAKLNTMPMMQYERSEEPFQSGPTWTSHVRDQNPPAWFERAPDFCQSLDLQVFRQVVHHQAGSHHVKGFIREGQRLDHTDSKVNLNPCPLRFSAGDRDHLRRRVNACRAAIFSDPYFGRDG